ncbi:MAG: response regulator [Pedobacter sp.]|nr:MAG: response regulator [Pedobacter sp.]
MKKILIVDDEPDITEVLNIILTDEGYDVRTLNTAANIQKEIDDFKPALLLLDVKIWELDGRLVAKAIRDLEKNKDLKICLVTGSLPNEEIKGITIKSFDAYIMKPFNLNDVLEMVAKLFA